MAQEVKDASGSVFLELKSDSVVVKHHTLKKDGNKYKNIRGDIVLSVKEKTDSLKFYDKSGKLAWKVKIYDDKIKISNNEENKDAWQVKDKEDKAKVYDAAERELFRVYFSSGKMDVKTVNKKKLYSLPAKKLSLAPGILALEHIPEHQRAVIFSELMQRLK
ncbi:MAG: hypothetical protein NE330_03095 [Lentisphaeraceae bacterium]|nr:hypothetical protein [Lentisphaeraceae bacterium]